jgi:hypothetical protein
MNSQEVEAGFFGFVKDVEAKLLALTKISF